VTPFDREMRRKGYRLTRFADDWLVTCRTRQEAQAVLNFAKQVLEKLGVVLNEDKTRIVHISQGFEFLGYKIKRGQRPLKLAAHKIKSNTRQGALYVYPRQKSTDHFKEQIRKRTNRKAPLITKELIDQINPVIRGWGNYSGRPMFEGYSTSLIAGLSGGFGHIATSGGATVAGSRSHIPGFMVSWVLSA
jgi:RNA-directed DNA polymerase